MLMRSPARDVAKKLLMSTLITALGNDVDETEGAGVHVVPNHGNLISSLSSAASWLENAAVTTGGEGLSHRIAVYFDDGDVHWLYKHSNTGELISAWLELAEALDRPDYIEKARAYAARMVEDPVKGLYRGACREAHGLPWYWTDGGSYAGIYAARLPFHFHRIFERTGAPKLLEICSVIGETFLQRLQPSGMVDAAWSPQRSWGEGGTRLGCRAMYSMATFATLYRITNDPKYRRAYEASVNRLQRMQNDDGSFYQHYVVETGAPHPTERSIKPFFYGYLLNAIAEAYGVFGDKRVVDIAKGIGNCLIRTYRYRNAIPYCTGREMLPADRAESDTAIYSVANGLLWLYSVTKDETYRKLGQKIWFDAWQAQSTESDKPGWYGAIIQGASPELAQALDGVPENRVHLNFDPRRVGKCTLWEMVNHVFAGRRLLGISEG